MPDHVLAFVALALSVSAVAVLFLTAWLARRD